MSLKIWRADISSDMLIWALYGVLEQWDLLLLTCWRLNALKCPSTYHSEVRGGWLRKTGCGSHMLESRLGESDDRPSGNQNWLPPSPYSAVHF
jgi:hypothetical protein